MRLIDADALDESGWWLIRDNRNQSIAQTYETKVIDSVSTVDAIPVVRCRECKHRYYYDDDEHDPVCTASMAYANTPDDWFCKDGQRKDEERTECIKVIHCRECLYRSNSFTGCPKLHGLETPDDFFCKYGKPKNGKPKN